MAFAIDSLETIRKKQELETSRDNKAPELGGLSDEEQDIIRKHRAEKAKAEEEQAFALKALQVAAQYEVWLHTHQRSDSFSTFTNEFGYQDMEAFKMHTKVLQIRTSAGSCY